LRDRHEQTHALPEYRGFEVLAHHRRDKGWWRVLAILDHEREDGSAERLAFVAEDPSLPVAEREVRERVDRWWSLQKGKSC
jgi:hypothetical protein